MREQRLNAMIKFWLAVFVFILFSSSASSFAASVVLQTSPGLTNDTTVTLDITNTSTTAYTVSSPDTWIVATCVSGCSPNSGKIKVNIVARAYNSDGAYGVEYTGSVSVKNGSAVVESIPVTLKVVPFTVTLLSTPFGIVTGPDASYYDVPFEYNVKSPGKGTVSFYVGSTVTWIRDKGTVGVGSGCTNNSPTDGSVDLTCKISLTVFTKSYPVPVIYAPPGIYPADVTVTPFTGSIVKQDVFKFEFIEQIVEPIITPDKKALYFAQVPGCAIPAEPGWTYYDGYWTHKLNVTVSAPGRYYSINASDEQANNSMNWLSIAPYHPYSTTCTQGVCSTTVRVHTPLLPSNENNGDIVLTSYTAKVKVPIVATKNLAPKVTYSSGAFDGCDKYKINATVQPNTSCSSSYKIYSGTDPNNLTEVSSYPDGNSKTGVEPYTVTYTFENLAVNTDYYYRVDAINGQGTTTGEVQYINKEGFPVECTPCVDKDGDGVYAVAPACYAGYDCDDNNPAVAEISWWYKDVDQDKYAFKNADGGYDSTYACNKPDDYTSADIVHRDGEKNVVYDCDDGDKAVKDTKTWYKDYDGDDYVADDNTDKKADSTEACEQPEGYKAADYAGFKKDGANFIFDCIDGSTIGEPISKASYPGAEEKCDGEDNNCNGKKDETCCEPTIKIVKDSIWPKIPTTQLLVTSHYAVTEVKVGLTKPAPPQKCKIKLREEQEADSGGHFHNEKRPLGTLSASEVIFAYGENESKIVKYTGSEASGVDRIYATTEMNGEKKEVSDSVTVTVPWLYPLTSGPNYKLKCDLFPTNDRCDARYKHKKFYYVRDVLLWDMEMIGAVYHYIFPDAPLLVINDASLESGGLYDVDKKWNTPHTTHRLGTDVDIRTVDGYLPLSNRDTFERLVCLSDGYPRFEPTNEKTGTIEHYHLYFYPYRDGIKNICKSKKRKK